MKYQTTKVDESDKGVGSEEKEIEEGKSKTWRTELIEMVFLWRRWILN